MAEKDKKQRTTVSINGQQYTIVGGESSSYIKKVATHVDQKMSELKKQQPLLDTTRLAVLTALNIADEYMKLKVQLERIERKKEEEDDA